MRNISTALQAHLEQDTTTTCRLLKITLTTGVSYGLTTLDRDVVYQGVTYSAANGFDPSNISSNTGYDVDNAEGYGLISGDVPGITLQMAKAGALDDAKWMMMLVNWNDLSMGHVIIDAGDIGEVTVTDNAVFAPELLSYTMRLRQAIGHVDQRKCRAVFGTSPNQQTGCGVNSDVMWVAGSVTAINSEQNRVFACSSLIGATIYYPGRIKWTSGDNSSTRVYQIEYYDNTTGTIGLFEPVPFNIDIGDQFTIRQDCDKTVANCKYYNNFLNYKGEPHIPVGDGVEASTPSAQTGTTMYAGTLIAN